MSPDLFEPEEESSTPTGGASAAGAKDSLRESRSKERVLSLHAPLAERIRPESFDEFLGQDDLLGPDRPLRRLIERGRLPSLIFWGPPGCGKTTLALLIAHYTESDFVQLSAVTAQLRDVRRVLEQARLNRRHNRATILFVDEIHRFNKAQQDAFLPAVELGTITLIGATTENPSFSVIGPLMSRCRVFVLKPLGRENLLGLLRRALLDRKKGLGTREVDVPESVMGAIVDAAEGDARRALNLLEMGVEAAEAQEQPTLSEETITNLAQRQLIYDREGEEHFNLISALHKSLRSSDPQAALYWMARMLASGENPLYIARRMIRFASEDVGLADPQALVQALSAYQTYHMLGSPEGELALVQACIYLATAPKSNSLYLAEGQVNEEIRQTGSLPTPLHIRNAPTALMRELEYGKGYTYDHEAPDHFAPKRCLPEGLASERFYEPGPFGFEREIQRRLAWWDEKRQKALGENSSPPAEQVRRSVHQPETGSESSAAASSTPESEPPNSPSNPPRSRRRKK